MLVNIPRNKIIVRAGSEIDLRCRHSAHILPEYGHTPTDLITEEFMSNAFNIPGLQLRKVKYKRIAQQDNKFRGLELLDTLSFCTIILQFKCLVLTDLNMILNSYPSEKNSYYSIRNCIRCDIGHDLRLGTRWDVRFHIHIDSINKIAETVD